MKTEMKMQFIKIGKERYRVSTIKRYKPFEREDLVDKFGIYVYFSVLGELNKVYHLFSSVQERDEVLLKLDREVGV